MHGVFNIVGETVRYHGRLPAQRLHPGTAHVHGYHGAELVATDALSPSDTGGDPPQSGAAGKRLSPVASTRFTCKKWPFCNLMKIFKLSYKK